jgi:hypothetical protein
MVASGPDRWDIFFMIAQSLIMCAKVVCDVEHRA